MDIDRVIEKYLPRRASKKWLEFTFGKPRYEFDLRAAEAALTAPVWDLLSRGGKRWRPLLFLLIVRALGGNAEKLKDFCIIPELIHNGSLIVDDIEDNSQVRRGRPCLHRIFGTDVAVNAGNFIYFLPLLILCNNKKKLKKEIMLSAQKAYAQEMVNLHLGQATDIYWHKGKMEKPATEKQYLQMCAFKTGCLSRLAAKLAVLLSGGGPQLAEKMGRVAEALGIAFQIQDDILNLTGAEFARKKGGLGEDITEGKRSLIIIRTLRMASKNDKIMLIEILNRHTKDRKLINRALAIIRKYGAVDYARERARGLILNVRKEIGRSLTDSPAKNQLKEFIDYLIERKI